MRKAKWIGGLLLVGFLGHVLSGCALSQFEPLARFEWTTSLRSTEVPA